MRATTNMVLIPPVSQSFGPSIPLAVECRPFADIAEGEYSVPLIRRKDGPLRCDRCGSYANAFVHFRTSSFVCNICGFSSVLAQGEECVAQDGVRGDVDHRPELHRGTVDYIAPDEYETSSKNPPATLFVLETTQYAAVTGVLEQVVASLRDLLAGSAYETFGLVTFDYELNFYSFLREDSEDCVRVVSMGDVEDPFVPLHHSEMLVSSQHPGWAMALDAVLARAQVNSTNISGVCVGNTAIRCAIDALAARGTGQVVLLHMSQPNAGVAPLETRDTMLRHYDKQAYVPHQSSFYTELLTDATQAGIAVHSLIAPHANSSLDVVSMGYLAQMTGGEQHLFSDYNAQRDGVVLHENLRRILTRDAAYGCWFKVRCSRGVGLKRVFAPWAPDIQKGEDKFEVASFDGDHTVVCHFDHGDLSGIKNAFVQVVILYTALSGKRLLRVQTLHLHVTSSANNEFRYADTASVCAHMVRKAAEAVLQRKSPRQELTDECVSMLYTYRARCTTQHSNGQLVLPEALKVLPLFLSALFKTAAFREKSDVRIAEAITQLRAILRMPSEVLLPYLYPCIFSLSNMPLKMAHSPAWNNEPLVSLPATLPATSSRVTSANIHLLETGHMLFLWVGEDVHASVINDAFGVWNVEHIDPYAELDPNEERLSGRIMVAVEEIRARRRPGPFLPLRIVLPNTMDEGRLFAWLCEDGIAGEQPYADYLCDIHTAIQQKGDQVWW
jgi:protein transport protein SEC24